MCPRRFVFARYPIVFRHSPGRPVKSESISAIGCRLPLRSNPAPDRKKSRDRVNAYRCKCCPSRIAGHPSNVGSQKRRWASLFVTPNAQYVPGSYKTNKFISRTAPKEWFSSSMQPPINQFTLRIETNPCVALLFHERKYELTSGRTQTF